MARKKTSSSPLPSPIDIGNCEVIADSNNFICTSNPKSLDLSLQKKSRVMISVMEEMNAKKLYSFLLVNPKDVDCNKNSLLQEVLDLYMKELPEMKYAANTGKASTFLKRCVFNGKYCTLILKSKSTENSGEVLAAITFQIIPADTQYAEIPLAAVSSSFQRKGIGRFLYMELRTRLHRVGICRILCWGDEESEGFWSKQGFVPIAEVDNRGRAQRMPIKPNIRKALCFPGGSTLMVSHLNKNLAIAVDSNSLKKSISSAIKSQSLELSFSAANAPNRMQVTEKAQSEALAKTRSSTDDKTGNGSCDLVSSFGVSVPLERMDHNNTATGSFTTSGKGDIYGEQSSCSIPGAKRRVWESSLSSLMSKKVKGGHLSDCLPDSNGHVVPDSPRGNTSNGCSLDTFRNHMISTWMDVEINDKDYAAPITDLSVGLSQNQVQSADGNHRIMLMNIADDEKKARLTKIIEDLGGTLTSDGSVSTHVITGKVRKTLNFCTALCSGAWILSPSWLKESFRQGGFMYELPFILNDEDYEMRYKSTLKDVILKSKVSPGGLLRGYIVCFTAHVQPPVATLSAIVKSAGGSLVSGLGKVTNASKTIFVACEEDMEEALLAARKGIRTFSSDWFMNCIIRQELDFDAPQFTASL